jgi:UDP-2,3-diacylglucosamine hydrolase
MTIEGKKVYFMSDAHLGSRVIPDNRAHEKKVVAWLDFIKDDASALFLVGDIFDFWFEYRMVVPKGYTRFLGKLSEISDAGIEIHFFTGNHDLWTFGYLENEIGMKVHYKPETITLGSKKFFMAHGDGLDPDDKGFNILREVFHSKIAQKLFKIFPSTLGQEFGYRWSAHNRGVILNENNGYAGENNENLILYAKKYAQTHDVDFMIFGHRHLPLDLQLVDNKRVIILGDFVSIFSYGVFDGENFSLEFY